jgi:GrpB-like predicted nucleotidyltransferase (UPF0157 family)
MTEQRNNSRAPATVADIEAYTIGGARRHDSRIHLAEYDPQWTALFAAEAVRIQAILGEVAIRIEHVGSTSVPGLAAKPIIDIVLEVPDSSNEPAYVAPLESHGYQLRIREPGWYEHRVLKGPAIDINLHVFTVGCAEVDRMLRFRDRLRTHPEDRELYQSKKRGLAAREWAYIQNYADAKTDIIEEILARTGSAAS